MKVRRPATASQHPTRWLLSPRSWGAQGLALLLLGTIWYLAYAGPLGQDLSDCPILALCWRGRCHRELVSSRYTLPSHVSTTPKPVLLTSLSHPQMLSPAKCCTVHRSHRDLPRLGILWPPSGVQLYRSYGEAPITDPTPPSLSHPLPSHPVPPLSPPAFTLHGLLIQPDHLARPPAGTGPCFLDGEAAFPAKVK